MEELSKIITVISLHTDVDRASILQGKSRKASMARDILCHTVNECCPHLMKNLCAILCISRSAVYKAEARENFALEEPALQRLVNKIRRDLSLPSIRKKPRGVKRERRAKEIPASQLIFGFKWKDNENMRIWGAEADSVTFMKKILRQHSVG